MSLFSLSPCHHRLITSPGGLAGQGRGSAISPCLLLRGNITAELRSCQTAVPLPLNKNPDYFPFGDPSPPLGRCGRSSFQQPPRLKRLAQGQTAEGEQQRLRFNHQRRLQREPGWPRPGRASPERREQRPPCSDVGYTHRMCQPSSCIAAPGGGISAPAAQTRLLLPESQRGNRAGSVRAQRGM